MKIGYDAKRAVFNNTGLGNYSRLVIEGIASENPEDSLLLYTPRFQSHPRTACMEKLANVEFRLPPPQGFKGSMWRTFGIPNNLRADGVDIYHGLSNELPLNITSAGIPTVLTIHDVIYRKLPHDYTLVDRILDDFKYGRSCRAATHIIAVSECTRKDVAEAYGIDPDKISVVYQGCAESFRKEFSPAEIDALRQRLNLPHRYILQVGTIEPRKNLELTVRALASVPEGIDLVAVGRDRLGYRRKVERIAEETGVRNRIHFFEGLEGDAIPLLNRAAEIIVYPSRYEGFGIPVLEGITCGRPVVAATGSCLEEAGGGGAIYVSPDSPREMANALNAIIHGETDVESIIGRGKEHSQKFNISDVASGVRSVYDKVVDKFFSDLGKKQVRNCK